MGVIGGGEPDGGGAGVGNGSVLPPKATGPAGALRRAEAHCTLRESQNVSVSGIGILNPNAWCVELYSCDNVDISGIKIISARPNGDGISVQSCRNVTVDLEEPQKISGFGILLNPRQIWNARTQDVEVQTSDDGEEFTTLLPTQTVEFDPMTDNRCYLPLDESVQARYLRFVFTANSGADAGQAAEIEVYKAK